MAVWRESTCVTELQAELAIQKKKRRNIIFTLKVLLTNLSYSKLGSLYIFSQKEQKWACCFYENKNKNTPGSLVAKVIKIETFWVKIRFGGICTCHSECDGFSGFFEICGDVNEWDILVLYNKIITLCKSCKTSIFQMTQIHGVTKSLHG